MVAVEDRTGYETGPRRPDSKPRAPWFLGGRELDEAEQYRPQRDPYEQG
jgi:hypothetical protein